MTNANTPPSQNLRKRIMNAGGWSLFNVGTELAFRLGSNLIMTRLLVPEAFGVMAMATVILTGVTLFTDIGISNSIMREADGDDPRFLRVAWVVRILRSVAIAAVLFVIALGVWLMGPSWASPESVYAAPELPFLLMLVAIAPILDGVASTKRELALRNLDQRRFALITLVSRIATIVFMVGFALIWPTVWALMVGMLSGRLAISVMTFIALPGPKMAFEWDAEISSRLWVFGRWIMLSSALTFLARSADKIILAGLLTSPAFGLVVIAQIWTAAAQGVINSLSVTVGFPAVAELIRTKPKEVPRLYRKFQTVVDVACVAAFLFAQLLGQVLIDLLYSEDYSYAGHYLQLLSTSFLAMRFITIGNLIMNTGDSRSTFIISSFRAAGALIGVPLGYWLIGTDGALLGAALAPMAAVPYILLRVRRILTTRQVLFDAAFAVATLALAIAVYILTRA